MILRSPDPYTDAKGRARLTSHGDVEDMELHKSLEITNALIAVHVISLSGSLYVCFALCNCSCTHTDIVT